MKVLYRVLLPCWFALTASLHAAEPTPEELRVMRREAFQKHFEKFPLVDLNRKLDEVKFQTVDLKASLTVVDGKEHFGFRFKTPEEVGNLIWSFHCKEGQGEWYIEAVKGEMQGFTHFIDRWLPYDVPNIGKKHDRFIMQSLPAEFMKPESEYIIWFRFKEGVEPTAHFSINMFKEGDLQGKADYPHIFKTMYKEMFENKE